MPPLRAVRGKSWTWFKILPLFYQETYMDESSAGSFVFPMSLFQSFAVIPPLIPKICSLRGLRHQSAFWAASSGWRRMHCVGGFSPGCSQGWLNTFQLPCSDVCSASLHPGKTPSFFAWSQILQIQIQERSNSSHSIAFLPVPSALFHFTGWTRQ